jgi:cysteinyl-tRNA synthetase
MVREINRLRESEQQQAAGLAMELRRLGGVLGILQGDPEQYLRSGVGSEEGLSDREIDGLIEQRLTARAEKNWAEADRIRDQLQDAGIVLEDGAGTTTWRRS